MEDEIMDIIYDKIKDSEELKSAEMKIYTNLADESVIKIKIGKFEYIVSCTKIFGEYNY